jgi:undecaprenyl diphosphate synthase
LLSSHISGLRTAILNAGSKGQGLMQDQKREGLHVAIIMDGNGRWATRRGLPRMAGHRAGVAALRRVVERAPDVGIGCLTVYAFSSDNWRRPASEVQGIFWLLRAFLRLETERLRQRGARLQVIGRRDRLANSVLREIERTECATAAGHGLHLRVANDYSSRDAITRAAAGAAAAMLNQGLPSINSLGSFLTQAFNGQCRDVDLLIRTGGEQRLSDFMLWESAYAELVFSDRRWPDFNEPDLEAALEEFSRRERRYGGLPAIVADPTATSISGVP